MQTVLQTWSTDAAAQSGPAHTWIGAWPSDIPALRAAVTAAGWQWRIAEGVDQDAAVVAAVFDVFMRRQRQLRQTRRNTPGQPHILLALGPDMPWQLPKLMRIAHLGRAVDVHLAVSAAPRSRAGRDPDYPLTFLDNITGWYSANQPLVTQR